MLSFDFSLLLSLFSQVGCNLLLFFLLLHFSLLADEDSILISFDDLSIDLFLKLSLFLILTFFFSLKLFHLLHHHLSLSFLFLSLLEPFDFSGFDLLDDDFLALKCLNFLPFLNLLKLFDLLESFDLH